MCVICQRLILSYCVESAVICLFVDASVIFSYRLKFGSFKKRIFFYRFLPCYVSICFCFCFAILLTLWLILFHCVGQRYFLSFTEDLIIFFPIVFGKLFKFCPYDVAWLLFVLLHEVRGKLCPFAYEICLFLSFCV